MEVIAVTQEGDYIVKVSKIEWDSLQEGHRPLPKNNHFDQTEAGLFFDYHHKQKTRLRGGLSFLRLYREDKFNGTLLEMGQLLNSNYPIGDIGPVTRSKIIAALDEYEKNYE